MQYWDVINRIWDEEAGFENVFPSSATHSRVHTHTPEGLPEGGVGVCMRGGVHLKEMHFQTPTSLSQ